MRTAAALSRTTSRRGPGSPAKMEQQDGGVGGGIASAQAVDWGGREADLLRREAIEGDGVGADFGELGWAGDGELVDARAACGCVGVGDAPWTTKAWRTPSRSMASATMGTQVRGVDAHDLGARSGGVGQRAEDVECGAHAEGAADGHDGLHGRMQAGGVQEGEAVAAQGGGPGGGGERDGNAEGFEDIGRAAKRGDGAVAVLGDCSPGGGGDQGGGGGDVEGAGVDRPRCRRCQPGARARPRRGGRGLRRRAWLRRIRPISAGGLAAGGDGPEQRGELEGVWAAGLIGIGAAGQDEIEQGARLAAREESRAARRRASCIHAEP